MTTTATITWYKQQTRKTTNPQIITTARLTTSNPLIPTLKPVLPDVNGTMVATYEYDVFGNHIASTGSVNNPYRYAGYRWDEETGLYYLNARYYAPEIGRFITRDSFHGFEDDPASLNWYNYAGSNPVMFVDPSGNYYISLNDISKYLLYIGLNPVATVLIGMGLFKLKAFITAKFLLLIAKLGAFWGPVVQLVMVGVAAIVGIPTINALGVAIWDCVVQGKKGIEIGVKRTWSGTPYGFDIYAK